MRLNDLRDGSIKTLLILGLLFANIAVALLLTATTDAPPPVSSERALASWFPAP